ncbi:MAG: transposase, partial [Tissierellia bacterium]|nr:transposase [Tissierellia bacterium]
MMNCFPLLYEDELFYSIISRYKRMCGITSKRAFLEDLFNKEIINKSIFFPQYIDALVNNLPLTSKITAEELIMNNTMFPFFTVFLSEEKTD